MTLGSISNSYPSPYGNIHFSQNQAGSATDVGNLKNGTATVNGSRPENDPAPVNGSMAANGSVPASGRPSEAEQVATDPQHQVKRGYKSSPAECQTCKERMYKDGSDEDDVSFKTPGHISPAASAATVAAHEQEHVVNAYEKAAKNNGRVISCSVSLQTAICPECGTSYVSGGTTKTAIAYPNEDNPYQKDKKSRDATVFTGANIDYTAKQYKNNITFE